MRSSAGNGEQFKGPKMKKQEGFSLIEVLVVIFFLGILAITLVSVFIYGYQVAYRTEQDTTAVQIAQEEFEFIRNMPFINISSYVSSASDFIQANMDEGERYFGYNFDKMEDISGALSMEDELGDVANIIKLTATITWSYKGTQMRKDVVTYITRGGINREVIY